jgi:DNA repair protein RadC
MQKNYHQNIKSWAVEDRPREKLLSKGIDSLSDSELLAIIIGSGTRKLSAVDLSKSILATVNNNLNELGKLSLAELERNKGIGRVRALTILAALELGRRRKNSVSLRKEKITSSKEVYELFQPLLSDIPHEEFWILLLNRSNCVIDKNRISQGGIAGTVIDTRIILRNALEKLASGLILCHNHPSGNPKPSEADISITHKLKDAAVMMDIKLLDHIIVADTNYFSFADEGII